MEQPEQHLIDAVRDAQRVLDAATLALSNRIVELSPFQAGDIVRHKETGALYKIHGGSGYALRGRGHALLNATRVYSTKRRPARSSSILSYIHEYEKYEGPVTL